MEKNKASNINTKFLVFLVLLAICFIRLKYPELSHGDDWGDANALNAGENMARLGIGVSHGLPIHRPQARELQSTTKPYDSVDPLNHFGTYTRTPPLYAIFHFVFRKLGMNDIWELRLVILALTFASVVFFYLFLQNWLKNENAAAFGTLFYICNPLFISNMDCLHFPVLVDFIRNACLFLIVGLQSCNSKTFKIRYSILFILFFFLAFGAYEYTVFFGIFLIFWIVINRKELNLTRIIAIVLLPSAFVLSFLLHLSLIAMHVGSFQEAFLSRVTNALARAVGDKHHLGSETFNWSKWLGAVGVRFPLQVLFYPVSTLVIAMVAASLCKTGEQKPTLLHKSLLLALGLGASGYAWYVLMPAHCLDHAGLTFLQRHLVPGVAVLFGGILATFLLHMLHNGWKPRRAEIAIWVLAIAACANSLLNSELPITREKIAAEQEFEKIVSSLRRAVHYLEYEDYVGMNVFRPTMAFGFYLKSRTLHIPDAASFEKLQQKPKVFLLAPINNNDTQKLADLLSKNYRVAFLAQNNRLPFYVFVRND